MRKILVLRGGALGDFIVTLPALAWLRQRWPAARIELVGNATAAALATARGLIDAAHSQHEGRWSALFAPPDSPLPAELVTWLAQFDLVFNAWPDPDGDLRRRLPMRDGQMYVSAAAMPTLAPAAAHYCDALREIGFDPIVTPPFVALRPLESSGAASSFKPSTPRSQTTLAVHPGSGSARKNWPVDRWQTLLTELGVPVLLILGEVERETWRARLAHLPDTVHPILMPSLEELVTEISSCRLFLGHDSGVSHLAAACGVPCVLLFGPTDPAMWAPPARHVRVLQAGPNLADLSLERVRRAVQSALADQR
jgi:heptosyltransferase-3